jgi:nucleoside-diphosphate-sugar epimerase
VNAVLLTGATGFVGGHVARVLVAGGWDVHALKRSTSDVSGLAGRTSFHDSDSLPASLFTRVRAVVHLATNYGRVDPASTLAADNTLFPLRLLERAVAANLPLFVNTDTCFTTEYKYLRPYTLSKKQFVQWGRILCDGSNTKFVNLVLQHPYGPGDRPAKFVPSMIRECLTAKEEIRLTPGEQQKDFVYVADVAEAYRIVLKKVDDLPAGFSEFEVGTGRAVSIRHFVETIHRLTGSSAKLKFGALDYRDGEIMFSQADISRLVALGWTPKTSLEDGLIRAIESVIAGKNE